MTITDTMQRQEPACQLVWDLPNQSRRVVELAGELRRPPRTDFTALGQFLTEFAAGRRCGGTVFANVGEATPGFQSFVAAVRKSGFGVFVRPRVDDSDIDDDLVAHVSSSAGALEHLLVGSHDRALIQRCVSAVGAECRVTVLGFEEWSSWAMKAPRVDFVDLEDIPGLIDGPLHRCLRRRLPEGGALLPPLSPLGSQGHTASAA